MFFFPFLNVWARVSVRTWPLSTRRPHLCLLRTHRTTHRWPKFRLPHSSLQWWYGIPDGFKTCQTSAQPIQSREAEQAESRCCQKAVFFVNRSIFEILQENWKRVVLFSPRLRLGLGRPFDMFREIVIPFEALTCAVCCANASESLFDKIYDEIMKFWWYSSINKVWIWICRWICEDFCSFLSFFFHFVLVFWGWAEPLAFIAQLILRARHQGDYQTGLARLAQLKRVGNVHFIGIS